jgi:hypothetical protein
MSDNIKNTSSNDEVFSFTKFCRGCSYFRKFERRSYWCLYDNTKLNDYGSDSFHHSCQEKTSDTIEAYKCPECDWEFLYDEDYNDHYTENHLDIPLPIDIKLKPIHIPPLSDELTEISNQIEFNIKHNHFNIIDFILKQLDIEMLHPAILLAYLRYSYRVKDKLSNWDKVVNNIKTEFDKRELNSSELLKGLI